MYLEPKIVGRLENKLHMQGIKWLPQRYIWTWEILQRLYKRPSACSRGSFIFIIYQLFMAYLLLFLMYFVCMLQFSLIFILIFILIFQLSLIILIISVSISLALFIFQVCFHLCLAAYIFLSCIFFCHGQSTGHRFSHSLFYVYGLECYFTFYLM